MTRSNLPLTSTTPMPSAVRSGGGSLLSSVPGGAIGELRSFSDSGATSEDGDGFFTPCFVVFDGVFVFVGGSGGLRTEGDV